MKKKSTVILIILMVVMLGTMIYYGNQKEGYHVDEVYSYGLANSTYLPFMHFGYHDYAVKDWMNEYGAGASIGDLFRNLVNDFKILAEYDFNWRETPIYQDYLVAQANSNDRYSTTWMTGQDYLDYVAVSEDSTFNYASVYYNQRGDVHPPLYYIILHTVCSVFPGVFSKWFALSVNIFFALLSMLLLYKTMKDYLGGEVVALSSVAVYAFSQGCMTNTLFLRMYMMLTFAMIAACYVHLRIVHHDLQMTKKERWLLAAVTLGGFLTHYYYVFFAIMLAIVFVIWMAIAKHWKVLWQYILTLAGTAVLGICVWPFAIKHIFFGYRGSPTWSALFSGYYSTFVTETILGMMIDSVFGGQGWIVILAAVLGIVAVVMGRKRKNFLGKVVLLAFPVVGFSVLIAQLAPLLTDRYIMSTYPLWCCLVVGSLYAFARELFGLLEQRGMAKVSAGAVGNRWIGGAVVLVTILLVCINNCYVHEAYSLESGEQEIVEVPENTDCIFVLADGEWNQSSVDATILAKCRRVGVSYYSNVHVLKEDYTYQPGDYLMLAIQKELDVDAVLAEMRTVFGLENIPEAYRTYGKTAVRIMLRAEQ